MSDGTTSRQLVLRRRDWAANTARLLAKGALAYHRLVVEGAEPLPHQGPALLLPKHRAYRDILVEGVVLYQLTGRFATYVMKVGLYGFLELLGGVKVVRPKDVRRIKDRQARRDIIRQARDFNQVTLDYLAWLYERGELIVSHPEGMRYQNEMGGLQREIIDHLLQVEQERGMRVPFIPIGLEYDSYARPRAKVCVRIGAPLYSDHFSSSQELVEHIDREIRRLSGFAQVCPV